MPPIGATCPDSSLTFPLPSPPPKIPGDISSEPRASGVDGGVTVKFTVRVPRLLFLTVMVTVCVVET